MNLSVDQHQRLSRAVKAIQADPMRFFRPSPKQAAFIADKSLRALLRAGNDTGKTEAGAIKAWNFVLDRPGSTLLVLCATHKIKVEAVGKKLRRFAPMHRLKASAHYNEIRGWKGDVIELDNGSKMVFRSAGPSGKGQTLRLSAIDADGLWIDEPPPAELMGEALARVRQPTKGQVWMTFTPIGRELTRVRELVAKGWTEHTISLTVEDCPWMTPEDIRLLCEGYGPWEYAQRVNGAWEGETKARVFRSYDPEVVDGNIPHHDWQVGLGLDHGELAGHETAFLLLWNVQHKLIWVLNEYVSTEATDIEQDAAKIQVMFSEVNVPLHEVDMAKGDVNSAGKRVAGKVSVNKLLGQELGIRIRPAKKGPGSVKYGIRLVNVAFGRLHLRIHPRCVKLIKAVSHWEGKKDDFEHLVDGLRYIAVPILETMYGPKTIARLKVG